MTTSLQDQTVLIINGSPGIGLAVAKLVVDEGARLTIASHAQGQLEQANQAVDADVNTDIINTLEENSIKAFFATHDSFDHIISLTGYSNGTGHTLGGGVLDSDIPTARNTIESAFWRQFYIGRYGGPKVKPGGSLTLTSGSGPPHCQAIATEVANAGVSVLAESLAKELAPVRVNVVAPYYVDTPRSSDMEDLEQGQLECVGQQLPMGQVSPTEDVAFTYLHVLQGHHITGTTMWCPVTLLS
ncbi:MAG: SDR family oxidoreductase [Cyanothece sp. SIO1E1]|nr:SDR family oxidoreductase [Cyanothece sp. SIO1E1]